MATDHELNDEAVERALRRLRPFIPLSEDETERCRELIRAADYRDMRRAEFKRNWPVIALVVSLATTMLTAIASYVITHWGSK